DTTMDSLYEQPLASNLANVITQALFYITGFVKAALQQGLDPVLCCWPHDRGKTHIPLGCYFVIRRQTGHVNETFGLADGALVERCNAGCEILDKRVELGIRQRPVHVSISFGEVPRNVVCPKEHFQRTSSPD